MAKRSRGPRQQPGSASGPGRTAARAGAPARRPIESAPRRAGRDLVPIAIVVGTVLVIAAVIVFALLNSGPISASNYECGQQVVPQQDATVADPMVMPNMGHDHVAAGSRLSYLNCPPTSGNHYQASGVAPARPAYYAPDASIGPGSWVHNLEHGYVVVLYRCAEGVCPEPEVATDLRRFVAEAPSSPSATACGYQSKVIVARFDQMSTPYALLAWDHLLLVEDFDRAQALDFARTWLEQPSLPERNGC